jgi:histidine triad (HIT) family protein
MKRRIASRILKLRRPMVHCFRHDESWGFQTMTTIFSKIIAREIPAEILHEDDLCLAFRDISPKAPTHFLVIPKKEIVSLAELSDEDEMIVGRCIVIASRVAAAEGLENGYRVVANTREDGGQEVDHLHFHVLGGRKMTWPPG